MRSWTPEDVDCVRETGVGTQAESAGTGMWFPPTASSSSRPSGTMPNSPQGRDQLTGNYEKSSTTPGLLRVVRGWLAVAARIIV